MDDFQDIHIKNTLSILKSTKCSLVINGDSGTGKTRLAKSIERKAKEWRMSTSYIKNHQLDSLLDNCLTYELLIVDDMNSRILTTIETDFLIKLIKKRYGRNPTIFIINLKLNRSEKLYTMNWLYTNDIVDMIIDQSIMINLNT